MSGDVLVWKLVRLKPERFRRVGLAENSEIRAIQTGDDALAAAKLKIKIFLLIGHIHFEQSAQPPGVDFSEATRIAVRTA